MAGRALAGGQGAARASGCAGGVVRALPGVKRKLGKPGVARMGAGSGWAARGSRAGCVIPRAAHDDRRISRFSYAHLAHHSGGCGVVLGLHSLTHTTHTPTHSEFQREARGKLWMARRVRGAPCRALSRRALAHLRGAGQHEGGEGIQRAATTAAPRFHPAARPPRLLPAPDPPHPPSSPACVSPARKVAHHRQCSLQRHQPLRRGARVWGGGGLDACLQSRHQLGATLPPTHLQLW